MSYVAFGIYDRKTLSFIVLYDGKDPTNGLSLLVISGKRALYLVAHLQEKN